MHHLVASYLEFKPAEPPEADTVEQEDGDPAPGRHEWLAGVGKSLQAPAGLATAANPEEALASLERMFFGEVHEL